MRNYSFVAPNLFALFVFLIYYIVRPRLPLKVNGLFPKVILLEGVMLLIAPLSSYLVENTKDYSLFIQYLLTIVFFMLFVLRGSVFAIFTANILKMHIKKSFFPLCLIFASLVAGEVLCLLNLRLGIIFRPDEDGYHAGKFYNLIYVFSFFYLALSFAMVFMRRKAVEPWRFWNTVLFNSILAFGYAVRFLLANYLILDSFYLLAIIVIYSKLESSALYFDARSGRFNVQALADMLDELSGAVPGLLMGVCLRNYRDMREILGNRQMDVALYDIGHFFFKAFPNLTSFYVGDGMFVLVGKKPQPFENVRSVVSERFSLPWSDGESSSTFLSVGFIRFREGMRIENSDFAVKAFTESASQFLSNRDEVVVVSEETIKRIVEKIDVKRAVEHAVENESTQLFIQPIMDAKTFKLFGAEALARIFDAEGKIIPPGVFIPIAEKNGRINCLGEQMFDKACAFVKKYGAGKKGLSWLNVNLSPIQFLLPDLNERFKAILERHGLDAGILHLEITEESMIDYALLQSQIQLMTSVGFKFVLDDYGKGYSNVSRLKKCPFINVKLDMEIVWDYFKTNDAIVPMLIRSFKDMGFSVTAEGIETEEMALRMRDLGCDYLQGYYFSKPLPADEFAKKYLL